MDKSEWPIWKVQCGNCGGSGHGEYIQNVNMEFEFLPCPACKGKGSILVSSPTPIFEPVYTSGILILAPTVDIKE